MSKKTDMSDIEKDVRKQLEKWAASNDADRNCTGRFLLNHGRICFPLNFSEHVQAIGAKRECFMNSRMAAIGCDGDLIYCEGVSHVFGAIDLIHHAWCINHQREVVETTWPILGDVYFGVPFTLEYVKRRIDEADDSPFLLPYNVERLPPDANCWRHPMK